MRRVVYFGNLVNVFHFLACARNVKLLGWIAEEEDFYGSTFSALLREAGVPVYKVKSDKDIESIFRRLGGIDLGVISNFGIILSEKNLRRTREGFVNAHLGLLPEYPGRNPIQDALRKGEELVGVTLHWVTAKVDAGPVISKKTISAGREKDPAFLLERLSGLIPTMLEEFLRKKAPVKELSVSAR